MAAVIVITAGSLSAGCGRTSAPPAAEATTAGAPGQSPTPVATPPASGSRSGSVGAAPQPTGPVPRDRQQAVQDARSAVRGKGAVIRAAKGEAYQPRDVVFDPDGARHVRFDRTYRGLPVLGGDYVVHSSPDGSFRSATVAQDAPIAVGTTPTVGRAKAESVATATFRGRQHRVTAVLVVDAADGTPRLAWRVVVEGVGRAGLPSRLNVVVDATSGAVRRSFDEVDAAEDGTGRGLHVGEVALSTRRHADGHYELIDPARGDGETRDGRNERYPSRDTSQPLVDPDNVWGDGRRTDPVTVAADVHYGVQEAWDYFKEVHGRNGIRDNGKGATAYVHYGVDQGNAAWSEYCFCMYFGDGKDVVQPFTQLDIVGHEMAHGVNRATANLQNSGESHGLNEANSDIFGTLVEFRANNPADPPDYLVAEKTNTHSDGTPLRRMDRPALDGTSDSCWHADLHTKDGHYSSGVGNKFFYTLAVGSGKSAWGDSPTCSGAPPVTGIGNDKAAQIWYRALTTYMVSTTDYAGARVATLSAASDLFGAGSTEYAAVDGAWKAVAVDGSGQAPSQGPTMADPGELTIGAVEELRLQLVATDPQGDELTFTSVWGLPTGLSMSPSGLVTGAPLLERTYHSLVRVTDPLGHRVERLLKWNVLYRPYVRQPEPQTGAVGRPVHLAVFAADHRHPVLRFSATGLPAGLSMDPQTGVITGVPTAMGTTTTTVDVVNSNGGRTAVTFTWTIGEGVPGAPTALVVVGGSGTATVTWQPPTPGGSAILGYRVDDGAGQAVTVPAHARTAVLRGLRPNTSFPVSVRATSAAGDGQPATTRLAGTASSITARGSVAHGATVTLSGRLAPIGGGRAVAGQRVQLQQRPAGQHAWRALATVVTTGNGSWSRTIRPATNAAYRVVFGGGTELVGSVSAARSVAVSYTVTVKASSAKPRPGRKVQITGAQRPARANTTVTLQRLVGRRWVAVTSTRAKRNGTYVFSRAFTRGTWTLRVVVPGGGLNATGASRTIKLTVR